MAKDKPLEFSSDEELVYNASIEEEALEDENLDMFKPRFDLNGQLLPSLTETGTD